MKEYGKTENLFARDPDTHMLTPDFKIPEVGLIRNDRWIVTEKIDGTNIRVIIHANGYVEVRGRSDNASLPKGLEDNIMEGFLELGGQLETLRDVCGVKLDPVRPIGFCFYGEGYGAGIQKGGGKYSAEKQLAVFDLATFIDRPDQIEPSYQYQNLAFRGWSTMLAASEVLGLETVPVISSEASIASIIELVYRGFSTQVAGSTLYGSGPRPGGPCESVGCGGTLKPGDAEGIVARTDPYLYYGRNKSRLMFKCKTEDLKKSEESLGLDQHIPVAIR